ncbi:unnamed protein product [Dicrocoelium dendriticum]|nr:unnamed protein product [Dicrocoelium dendriticum]
MGNVVRRIVGVDCIGRCFGRHYKVYDQPDELGKCSLSTHQIMREKCESAPFWSGFLSSSHRRNRIAEYITWALNRSRSPLLMDDALATPSAEFNSGDFTGINSASWISEGTASDASHALYREMDPYNYRSMYGSLIRSPSSSSVGDGVESAKTGSWVAVTRLSGSRNQTTTSAVFLPHPLLPSVESTVPACEEEVDGLELARLSRSLWPKGKSKQSKPRATTTRTHTVGMVTTSPQSATRVSHPLRSNFYGDPPMTSVTTATRPTMLNLRSTTKPAFPANDPLQSRGDPSTLESPVELFWDHEPGAMSPTPRTVISPRKRPSPDHVRTTYAIDDLDNSPIGSTPVNLYPIRPRRRTHNLAPSSINLGDNGTPHITSNTNGSDSYSHKFIGQSKRWSYSDRLTSFITRPHLLGSKTSVPYTNLLFSPGDDSPSHPSQDLVDSGFVGLTTSSCAETTSDDGLCPMSDFLWEHELIEEPAVRRPRLKGIVHL